MTRTDPAGGAQEVRIVPFETSFNFRDLGGYQTRGGGQLRWNVLYRSDTLHRLSAADATMLASLGLRTVIDLRSLRELEDHGRLAVEAPNLAWHNLPMLDGVTLRPRAHAAPPPVRMPGDERYFRMLEDFGPSIAAVFALLARSGSLPAAFHCTSGKDRTGVVAALVLDLVGVPDEVIAADYALTDQARARGWGWLAENEPEFYALLQQIPPEARKADPRTMLGFLDRLRASYGSAAGYLLANGVTEAQQQAVRQSLIEG